MPLLMWQRQSLGGSACLLLTFCCAAQFVTGYGPELVRGPRVGDPCYKVQWGIQQCVSYDSSCGHLLFYLLLNVLQRIISSSVNLQLGLRHVLRSVWDWWGLVFSSARLKYAIALRFINSLPCFIYTRTHTYSSVHSHPLSHHPPVTSSPENPIPSEVKTLGKENEKREKEEIEAELNMLTLSCMGFSRVIIPLISICGVQAFQ